MFGAYAYEDQLDGGQRGSEHQTHMLNLPPAAVVYLSRRNNGRKKSPRSCGGKGREHVEH
jgi:hypothetical protein